MSNQEKYNQAFVEALVIEPSEVGSNLVYQGVSAWDSVGHMQLVAALEDAFDIMLDAEDIIDFSSYDKGKEILRKYDVEL